MDNNSIEYSIDEARQKITFVGDSGVGKTTIIKRLNGEPFSDLKNSSIGIDYYLKIIKYKGQAIKLQIWDTAGQEKYRGLVPSYVRNSSLVFLIYDITSRNSFNNLPKWIEFLKSIQEIKLIICGNKIDLKEREVSKEEGGKFAKKEGFPFFEVSAKTEENMNNMLFRSVTELPFFEKEGNINKEALFQELINENEITIENNGKDNNKMGLKDNKVNNNEKNQKKIEFKVDNNNKDDNKKTKEKKIKEKHIIIKGPYTNDIENHGATSEYIMNKESPQEEEQIQRSRCCK